VTEEEVDALCKGLHGLQRRNLKGSFACTKQRKKRDMNNAEKEQNADESTAYAQDKGERQKKAKRCHSPCPYIPARKRRVHIGNPERALRILQDAINDLRRCGTAHEVEVNAKRGRALAELIRTYMTTYDVYTLRKQYEDLEEKVQKILQQRSGPPAKPH